jgi:hypothetical protein
MEHIEKLNLRAMAYGKQYIGLPKKMDHDDPQLV